MFVFGEFEVDEDRFELRWRGKRICVQPLVLEIIMFLGRSPGRLVTKDDLIAGPWKGAVVSDGAVNQAIMLARRALGVGQGGHAIVTIRGKGFRFEPEACGVSNDTGTGVTAMAGLETHD